MNPPSLAALFPAVEELLRDIANDYEDEGCDGCGTVSRTTINRVRGVLGWDLIEDETEEEND